MKKKERFGLVVRTPKTRRRPNRDDLKPRKLRMDRSPQDFFTDEWEEGDTTESEKESDEEEDKEDEESDGSEEGFVQWNVNTFIFLYVLFGNQDQPWLVAMLVHEHPGLAVGIPPRVVDQSAKATRVHRCVDAPPLPPSAEVVDITSERAWVGIVVSVS